MTDPNQTSGAAKTRRWFRRPWVLAIAAVLLIVGGIWANHRWERAKGRREIDKRLVRLRAIGVPADLSKFAEQFPDPPPEKNAERILGSGLHEIEFPSDWPTVPIFRERPIPGRLRAWSNEERAETWNYLESQQEALSKVSDSALEGAWFRPYVTNNFPYPHRWTYWLIGLLQLRALEPIESGSHDQAVHELEKSLAVIVALPQGTYRNHRGFTGWMSSGSKLMESS